MGFPSRIGRPYLYEKVGPTLIYIVAYSWKNPYQPGFCSKVPFDNCTCYKGIGDSQCFGVWNLRADAGWAMIKPSLSTCISCPITNSGNFC